MKTTLLFILLGGLLVFGACNPKTAAPAPTETQSSAPGIKLTSPVFAAGQAIPAKYTCTGSNISPAVAWGEPPAGTQSFALILTDPDAPLGSFVHWVIYNIPGSSRALPEAVAAEAQLADGSLHGNNGAGWVGYIGPCPPSGVHHYVFALYALDTSLSLASAATKDELLTAMQGHILAQSELIGTFGK